MQSVITDIFFSLSATLIVESKSLIPVAVSNFLFFFLAGKVETFAQVRPIQRSEYTKTKLATMLLKCNNE